MFLIHPRIFATLFKDGWVLNLSWHRNDKRDKPGGVWQVNRTKSIDSDGGSSGYSTDKGSKKGLVSPDNQPPSHRDKIGAMSKQAFKTTDFRNIAGQPKVSNNSN